MIFVFESRVQQLSLLSGPGDVQAGESTRCTDNAAGAAFPGRRRKLPP